MCVRGAGGLTTVAADAVRRSVPPVGLKEHPEIPEGIPVLSRNGAIRGRSLGLGQLCPARGCIETYGPRWQLGVEWETGQTTVICDVGWVRRHAPVDHVRIIAGGEITARFVTPRDPKPDRNDLPKRWLDSVPWTELGWNPLAEIADHRRPDPPSEPT